MFRKSLFTTGLCAASLSVAMLAGCSSPVAVPTTPTEATTAPVAGAGAPAAPVSEPASPALPAPAAAAATTLTGKATYRGEALSGFAVSVFDAQTGKAIELKADLAGVDTLAVLNQNLVTDAQGAFSLQVVGLKAGQALRVVVSKGNGTLETVVTSDLKAVGSAKLHVLAEGGNLTINELTTAIAKVARGVLSTTQVLTPEAAAPVLAKLATEMAALSGKLETALAKNPNLAPGLISNESKSADASVKSLVESANALKDLTKTIAGLVGDVAKASKETGKLSASVNDEAVKAVLAKIEFVGTVLAGAFANNDFTLTNALTGKSVDATAGDFGDVTETVTAPSSGSRCDIGKNVGEVGPNGVSTYDTDGLTETVEITGDEDDVAATFLAALTTADVIVLHDDVTLAPGVSMSIARKVIIDGNGHTISGDGSTHHMITPAAAETVLHNLVLDVGVQVQADDVVVQDSTITPSDFYDGWYYGLMIDSAQGVVIRNCTFEGAIDDDYSHDPTAISDVEGGAGESFTVENCAIRNAWNGVIASGESNVTVRATSFTQVKHAIYLYNNLSAFSIVDNEFLDPQRVSGGTLPGDAISLSSASDEVLSSLKTSNAFGTCDAPIQGDKRVVVLESVAD